MAVESRAKLKSTRPAIDRRHERIYQFLSFSPAEPGVPNEVSSVRESTLRFARHAGIAGSDLVDIQIAIGEALSNAVKHGSPAFGKSRISVGCEIVDGVFIVTVSDHGDPFDDQCIPDPNFDDLPECGLGLYLMKQLMDCVEFTRNDIGNSVKMVKKLAQAT